jgi:uncharacterized protein (DUF608 family)
MIAMEGTGALSHISLRHAPDIANEPAIFSAICVKDDSGNMARVLEGQVPAWKILGTRGEGYNSVTTGLTSKSYGLPRFASSLFKGRFPFGHIELRDPKMPVDADITAWSPFVPLNADDSSLPAAALEFTLTNRTDKALELVYSFHAPLFLAPYNSENKTVTRAQTGTGFVLEQTAREGIPWEQAAFSALTDHPGATADCAWFRGGWFDPITMVWNGVEAGKALDKAPIEEGKPSPGGSIYVPLTLEPGASETIRVMLAWYVPESKLSQGVPKQTEDEGENAAADDRSQAQKYYKPWYAGKFRSMEEVSGYWAGNYDRLRSESLRFTETFFHTSLPAEAVEAIAANLSILKSPTVMRQTDGRFWGWEGSLEKEGSCHGTCTHVWNYAQALPHLFPELERGVRAMEFQEGQDESGHQNFRIPLPIQPADHGFHAACDGQLGGIMKVYREWRISGDSEWMKQLWPNVKTSLNYCIETWDPAREGILSEPHHNTYDIEFWGPDGMCSSIYLGALKAATLMADALGEDASEYGELYRSGRDFLESELFNGEYFEQRIVWEGLRAPSPTNGLQAWNVDYSKEAIELLQKEGPKYQYGQGCLSDGVIGAWLAEVCGVGEILDREKVKSHLLSIYKYNLKRDLSQHANPQRPGYALGSEGGLLLCTWPKGGRLSLPFVYSDEVWTGIEYQVASHLLSIGCVEEGLDIVRICRDRYDGSTRNPFNEYECGFWYARALASYALIQGWSGIRYDAIDKTLFVSPKQAGDYSSFLCAAGGYGIAGMKDGQPFVEVKSGRIDIERVLLV